VVEFAGKVTKQLRILAASSYLAIYALKWRYYMTRFQLDWPYNTIL